MVSAARKETEAANHRTDQVRAQLKDAEVLLASHQEQLAELKGVMQAMSSDQEEVDSAANGSTAPPTPALPQGEVNKALGALHITPVVHGVDDISPGPPTSFSYLLSPVLRTDLQNYEDFKSLLQLSHNKSAPPSRVGSGSYSGITIPGLGSNNRDTAQKDHKPSNSSNVSLAAAASQASASNTTSYSSNLPSPIPPLKETRFYKRALTEDIEPTLRLDTAPGLSWIARRTVVTSMSEGSLVVEPMPASTKMQVFSCALCGENRKGSEFTRNHRFRTSESETAQRYALCGYCLNRVRAACDYLGFLRMVKDGHWRTDGPEAEKAAWEESVRLRERMFWARIGGGVVPAYVHRDSPRPSHEESRPVSAMTNGTARDSGNIPITLRKSIDDPFVSGNRREAPRAKRLTRQDSISDYGDDDWETAKNAAIFADERPTLIQTRDAASKQLQVDLENSLRSSPLRESLRPRHKSRAASYERHRVSALDPDDAPVSPTRSSIPTPHSLEVSRSRSGTRSRSSSKNGPLPPLPPMSPESGLQIKIPGTFE
jgi:hypothetical protein